MKKVLSATLACVLGLAAASPAFATNTRINSLSAGGTTFGDTNQGQVFNEKLITVRDSSNIYPLPQYMVTYKNSVDTDATIGASYGTMNIRYALSDDSVLLLFGKRSPWAPVTRVKSINGLDAPGEAGFNPVPKDPTNHQFGIGFGLRAGESLRLGATLSVGGHRADGPTTSQHSNTLVDFAAGVGFDLSETNSLDFGLGLTFGAFTNVEGSQDRYVSNGLFSLALLAKGEFQVHQIAKIVPYLRFGYDGRGVVHVARNDEPQFGNEAKIGTVRNIHLNLGSDLAISPVEGVLIQPGIGLALRTSAVEGNNQPGPPAGIGTVQSHESSMQLLPWYGFAAEAKAFDWMVLRVGARQTIVKQDDTNTLPQPATNEKHTSDVSNVVTTGVGLKLMGWDLDFNVTPSHFNNGVYAVSGTGTPFAVDFAIGYDW